ncbi:unnamed protein product [Ceutorhynchus assimilis]|uniref:Uncharacterized protein n=1 Tax=Ceutorhynchus assimilis TaxID=467358 RepID=A0A9N9MK80_9CUCU|nr:unnamed protein product [Ceutorhynchus assimilis]
MTHSADIFQISKEIVFPDESNRYLKEQITGFMHENQMLRKNLEESTQKYKNLQNRNEDLKNKLKEDSIMPLMQQSPSINSKIVELSKNLREKCVELEKYKTKHSKLVAQIEELKQTKTYTEESKPNNEIIEIKQLKEKLRRTNNKILEYKNIHNQLKEELKQAKKLIEEEIGLSNNNHKSRLQIIKELQEKNKKLKDKLKVLDPSPSQKLITNPEKPKIAALENQLTELEEQNQSLKFKNNSLKARCKMLEVQQQDLKVKLQKNDEKCLKEHLNVIENLSKSLSDSENIKKTLIKDKDSEMRKLKKQIDDVTEQVQNYKNLIQNLKDRQQNNCEAENEATADLQEEKSKLLKLIKQQNEKLDEERNNLNKCQQLLRIKQQKTVKLEAAIAQSEVVDSVRSRHSYTSLLQKNSETDLKNQLELAQETIKSLQDRLQVEQSERKRDFQEFSKILLSEK